MSTHTSPDLSQIDLLTLIGQDVSIPSRPAASTDGGEYKTACPFCGGEDRFCIWPHHPDGKGRWGCPRGCERQGDAIDYLQQKHGLNYADALSALGLNGGQAPARSNGKQPPRRPRMPQDARKPDKGSETQEIIAAYPYEDTQGQVLYEVVRLEPKNFRMRRPDGQWGIGDVGRVLYHLPEVVEGVKRGDVIYIVEGEKSADFLRNKTLVATTSPNGAGNWRDEYGQALAGAQVAVIADEDTPGHKHVDQVAASLYSVAASVKVLHLPGLQFAENHGPDVVDWWEAGHSLADLHHVYRDTPEWQPPAPDIPQAMNWRLLTPDQVLAMPPVEYLIPNEIPARGLTVMFGPSGSGKSFLALDYALQVAQTQPAVFIAGEGQAGYADRLTAWAKHNGQGYGQFYLIDNAVPLLNNGEVEALISQLSPLSPALIVIDTLARAMLGGDENSARDMGLLIQACNTIQRATGAAVLLVHHTGKTGASERGSSALRGAADCMIELSNDDGLIMVSCSKSKDAEPFDTRYLRLLPVVTRGERSSCVLIEADRILWTKEAALTRSQKAVLDVLSWETFLNAGCNAKVLAQQARVSENSIYRILRTLMKRGYVRQASKGEPYYIEPAGLDIVRPKPPEVYQPDLLSVTVKPLS